MKAKTALLIFPALALTAVLAFAGVQDDFDLANQRYEEGRYAEALALYGGVEKQIRDWKVHFNIGNCHFKMKNYVEAKVSFLRARRMRPLEPAIARNIAMANRHFRDDVARPRPDFITRAGQWLESALSLDALGVLLLAAVLVLNACLFRLLTRGRNKALAYALAFSLLAAAVLGAYLRVRTAALGRSEVAVVVAADARLRSGPGEDNTVLFQVHPGLEVRVIDRLGDWIQVTASERIAGWIEIKKLVLI
ncbi:MAG: SH3 domain-containing protein [Candidatus Aminicenantes bacterium]|nr:SH3 domain-containing protein [Candidatus Aminicenantes bacterium]